MVQDFKKGLMRKYFRDCRWWTPPISSCCSNSISGWRLPECCESVSVTPLENQFNPHSKPMEGLEWWEGTRGMFLEPRFFAHVLLLKLRQGTTVTTCAQLVGIGLQTTVHSWIARQLLLELKRIYLIQHYWAMCSWDAKIAMVKESLHKTSHEKGKSVLSSERQQAKNLRDQQM
jgi:hypothetical protein